MVWSQPLYNSGLKFSDFTCGIEVTKIKRKPMSSMTNIKTEVLEIDSTPFQAAYTATTNTAITINQDGISGSIIFALNT